MHAIEDWFTHTNSQIYKNSLTQYYIPKTSKIKPKCNVNFVCRLQKCRLKRFNVTLINDIRKKLSHCTHGVARDLAS